VNPFFCGINIAYKFEYNIKKCYKRDSLIYNKLTRMIQNIKLIFYISITFINTTPNKNFRYAPL
jgi:hypothetical protein